jgi:hypothetical protein
MTKQPHFTFDRTLTQNEFVFWQNFCDHLPTNHNSYLHGILNRFAHNTPNKNLDLYHYYDLLKDCSTTKEMFSVIKKQDWQEVHLKSFEKVALTFNQLIPEGTPLELFLMTIYSCYVADFNLELTPKGINFINTNNSFLKQTHTVELALMVDLMGGRLNDIFPKLNLPPVNISGEFLISTDKNKHFTCSICESNIPTYLKNNNSTKIVKRFVATTEEGKTSNFYLDFSFDFFQNSNNDENKFSPLHSKQKNLLNIIENNYLNSLLASNNTTIQQKLKI